MTVHETYRINSATLAIHSESGDRTPMMIPTGALVTLVAGPLDGLRMVDVNWYGKIVMMFAGDLRDRATLVIPDSDKKG